MGQDGTMGRQVTETADAGAQQRIMAPAWGFQETAGWLLRDTEKLFLQRLTNKA